MSSEKDNQVCLTGLENTDEAGSTDGGIQQGSGDPWCPMIGIPVHPQ